MILDRVARLEGRRVGVQGQVWRYCGVWGRVCKGDSRVFEGEGSVSSQCPGIGCPTSMSRASTYQYQS